jgi:hypothetical protein
VDIDNGDDEPAPAIALLRAAPRALSRNPVASSPQSAAIIVKQQPHAAYSDRARSADAAIRLSSASRRKRERGRSSRRYRSAWKGAVAASLLLCDRCRSGARPIVRRQTPGSRPTQERRSRQPTRLLASRSGACGRALRARAPRVRVRAWQTAVTDPTAWRAAGAAGRGTAHDPGRPGPTRARVLDRGGSGTRTGESHVRDSAGRGGGLDLVVLLDALQSVPEAYASAEQDRDHHGVHVVDEPGSKELADRVGPPPMRTSWPPAASRAVSSASAGDASMKWNVVPPSISIDGRV